MLNFYAGLALVLRCKLPRYFAVFNGYIALALTNPRPLKYRHVNGLVPGRVNLVGAEFAQGHPLPVGTPGIKPAVVAGFRVESRGTVRVYL